MRIRDWRLKATAQRLLSVLPGGYRLNYRLQRGPEVSPISDRGLDSAIAIAVSHVANLERHGACGIDDARSFEFGAGWDLHVPLALRALGARHQVVVDIRDLLRPDLVSDVARRLPHHAPADRPTWEPPSPPGTGQPLTPWLRGNGIDFRAPCDARDTGLPAASIDVVTSTNTLEHISPDDITAILAECRRLLAPGGIASFQIDYGDHYSYFDDTIGPYHFLTISQARWKWINCPMHYQNRLRHPQYLHLVRDGGFDVIDEVTRGGGDDDVAAVKALDLAAPFGDMPPEELAIRSSVLTLRPRT